MSIWWLVSLFALGYASCPEQPESTARPAPADLVQPSAGSPLSAQQVEERVRILPDGRSTVDTARSMIYRDSAGRLRIESIPSGSGESSTVFLIDPTSGSRTVLSVVDRTACRVVGPKAGEDGFANGVGGMGEGLPPGPWTTSTEKLGRRTIEGIEVEGRRVTQTSADQPSLAAIYDRWYSSELRVVGLAVASGPYGAHTARIQNLHRGEPDPTLFMIPAGYKIVDL